MKKFLITALLAISLISAQAIVITNPNGRPVNWQQMFTNQQAMLGILECLITGFDSSGNYSVINRIWVQNDSLFISKMDSVIFITKVSDFEKSGPENNMAYSISSGETKLSVNKMTDDSSVTYTGIQWVDTSLGINAIIGMIKVPSLFDSLWHPGLIYIADSSFLIDIYGLTPEGIVINYSVYRSQESSFLMYHGPLGVIIQSNDEEINMPEMPFKISNSTGKQIGLNRNGGIEFNGSYINTGVYRDSSNTLYLLPDISNYIVKADTSISTLIIYTEDLLDGQEVLILFENNSDSGTVVSNIIYSVDLGFTVLGESNNDYAEIGEAIRVKRVGTKIFVFK